MGFREPLDLTPFLEQGQTTTYGDGSVRLVFGPPTGFTFTPDLPSPDEVLYLEPTRNGLGTDVRSTCLEVERWPTVVWDVNGYYRALGVSFRATRKQLMQAYNDRDGQSSRYLTYVLSQLLNPAVRRRYDAAAMHGIFMDRYVEETLKRRAQEIAHRVGVDPEEILDHWGLKIEKPEGEEVELVDIPQESGEDETTQPPAEEPQSWPYAYYVWRLRRREDRPGNVEIMRRWQEAVAAECQAQGVVTSFAVGLMRHSEWVCTVMSVGDARVAFLHIDHADQLDRLTKTAVRQLIHSGI